MITKEITETTRIRARDGSTKKTYDFDRRSETCKVITWRFLGIPFYRRTELINYCNLR